MEEIYRGSSLFNAQPNNFDNQNVIMYKARGSPMRSGIAGRIATDNQRSTQKLQNILETMWKYELRLTNQIQE